MNTTLQMREDHVNAKLAKMMSNDAENPMDNTLVDSLFLDFTNKETRTFDGKEISMESEIASREGLHDYMVMISKHGYLPESITFDDFMKVRSENPEDFLSFSTGKHRALTPEQEAMESADQTAQFHVAEEDNSRKEEAESLASDVGTALRTNPSDLKFSPQSASDDETETAPETETDDMPYASDAEAPSTVEVQDAAEETVPVVEEGEVRLIQPVAEGTSGRITSEVVQLVTFEEKRAGYDEDDVDEFLDRIARFMQSPHTVEEVESMVAELKGQSFESKRSFSASRFDANAVDNFIAGIITELETLLKSN